MYEEGKIDILSEQ